ncbi:ATP-binding cassette domain-containing protein [Clostridium tertium]|uniref:ABC transporter ATP-binding protein YtrB n=1 Tax=Clostridium tertium TaxID=1559 RepID=A0A6N3BM35_9CLOT
MEAIEIKGLEKNYNNFKLDIKELVVKKGFITGFIGPNGSGKTTTIKAIMNMVKADKGDILVLGEDIKTNTDIKETLAFVGDTCGFLEESKLKNIKKLVSKFYKNWDETLYKELLDKFNLDESMIYGKLSKGKKKQFELAMALATKPKVIIMDEPTANLDPVVRNEFLEVLQEQMEDDDKTVFYSTHITSDLEKCADYIIFIYKGQVILQGEKDYILETHSIIKGKKELLDIDTKKALISVKTTGYNFEGLADNKENAFDVFGNEVIYERPTLEDIMLYYTGRK